MKVVEHISIAELTTVTESMFGILVKVDVDMGVHADGEAYLIETGSKQKDLWEINLHPTDYGTDDFIEFDALINIRPNRENVSKDVLNRVR